MMLLIKILDILTHVMPYVLLYILTCRMLIGTLTGVMGNIFNQEGFSKKDWISALMGLGLGATVTTIFVLCSGSLICQVVRPWKIANENLQNQKNAWEQRGKKSESFYDSYGKKEDPDGDFKVYDIYAAGFDQLGMPFVSQQLCKAGFTLDTLKRVNNEVLLDQLLQGAGVDLAGDRLRVILWIRDGAPKMKPLESASQIEPTSMMNGDNSASGADDSADEFEKWLTNGETGDASRLSIEDQDIVMTELQRP